MKDCDDDVLLYDGLPFVEITQSPEGYIYVLKSDNLGITGTAEQIVYEAITEGYDLAMFKRVKAGKTVFEGKYLTLEQWIKYVEPPSVHADAID